MDVYGGEKKGGGGWMDEWVGEMGKGDGCLEKGVGYLSCKLKGGVNGKGGVLSEEEVMRVLEELGEGVEDMVRGMERGGVWGMRGVGWDGVEVGSEFMEKWWWEGEGVGFMCGEYERGEGVGKELVDKMVGGKK